MDFGDFSGQLIAEKLSPKLMSNFHPEKFWLSKIGYVGLMNGNSLDEKYHQRFLHIFSLDENYHSKKIEAQKIQLLDGIAEKFMVIF